MSMEFCVYCLEPKRERFGCCGENHFSEIYAFLCEDLTHKDYPYGVEWSFYKDGRDIVDVEWFATDDERMDFIESEGFELPREVFEAKKTITQVYESKIQGNISEVRQRRLSNFYTQFGWMKSTSI